MAHIPGGNMPKQSSNDQDPVANFDGLERCRELVDELRTKLDPDAVAIATPLNDGAEQPVGPSIP